MHKRTPGQGLRGSALNVPSQLIPELELVVVFTAGNYMQGGIWGRFRDQIVPKEIIPAIRR